MAKKQKTPHVALQMAPHNFYDEGIDHVLDTLQSHGGVQEIFVYSQVLHDTWGQRSPDTYPDHGVPRAAGERPNISRVWHRTHEHHYRGLPITLGQDPDAVYGGKDIFDDLAEPIARRGMRLSAFILEPWQLRIPNWSRVGAVDADGKRNASPCPINPDYRAWWNAGIEDLMEHHPQIGGLLYGQERGTSLSRMLTRDGGAHQSPVCFCTHCEEAGERRGINVERARRGMKELQAWTLATRDGSEPNHDGAFVALIRLFFEYPEILAWDRMFHDAMETQRYEIYGLIHSMKVERKVGWHIETASSFDPFRRALNDLRRYRGAADFVKLVVYSNPNGYRAREYFWRNGSLKSWLSGVPEELAVPFLYAIMGYDPAKEPSAAELGETPVRGFSDDYVYRETLRGVRAIGDVPMYAGIGIDIPPGAPTAAPTTKDSAYADTVAALRAGAKGILISRDYTEMQLEGISGVGAAVADWKAGKVS